MSEAKHTKGPWKLIGKFDADISVSIEDGDGHEIAEFFPSGIGGEWEESQIKNIQLIAAAPDLLAALELAARILRTAGWHDFINHKEMKPINAAIALATGASL